MKLSFLHLSSEMAGLVGRPIRKVKEIIIKPVSKDHVSQLDSTGNFKQMKLRDDIIAALRAMNITQPTTIQMLACPQILKGKNVLCASETGSGKTLAYLIPLINRLKDEETHHGLVPRLRRPRALIVVPTRDLANQILSVAKSMSHVVKLRVLGLIGGHKKRFVKEALLKPVDVAIATPDSLLKFKREERIGFSDVSHLVIDETDTLFEESFNDALSYILKTIKIRTAKPKTSTELGKDAQVTFVSATVSNGMLIKLSNQIPNLKTVTTKHVHRILPNIEQRLIKVLSNEKSELLLKILKESLNTQTIVFCNTVPSCDWTGRFLESHDIPLVKLHGGLNAESRQTRLEEFLNGNAKVLVCTDIASRGVDTTKVSQVIQFDWPNSLEDYLHRVGRTGRIGCTSQRCRGIAFMTHRRDVRMAWMIKDSADRKEALLNKDASRRLNILKDIKVDCSNRHLSAKRASGGKEERRFDNKLKTRKQATERKRVRARENKKKIDTQRNRSNKTRGNNNTTGIRDILKRKVVAQRNSKAN